MFVNRTFKRTIRGDSAITVSNPIMGHKRTAVVPHTIISDDEVKAYQNGVVIQEAFKNLNSAEREFIKSGMTSWEQRDFFDGPHEKIRFAIRPAK